MSRISQRELRNESGRVLREVEAGQTYEVTVSGRVVARLSPASDSRRRFVDPVALREIARLTPVDAASWNADIDSAFDDEMDDDPWVSGPSGSG